MTINMTALKKTKNMRANIDVSDLERIGDKDHADIGVDAFNEDQHLVFLLGDEFYTINVLSVKEISRWHGATFVPNSPNYVKGVINLRGNIVPIIDLRIKFKVGEATYLKTTVVVILSGVVNKREKTIGFIVDSVWDVVNVEHKDSKYPYSIDGTVDASYINGVVNVGDNLVTMLDVNQLLLMDS